jgi:protein-S-isoprenylcysteine O-methyltransferase Ste14
MRAMTERTFFDAALVGLFVCAAVTVVALLRIAAPYGRHVRKGFGATMPSTAGWILMEAVAAIGMPALFLFGDRTEDPAAIALLALWEIHYLHRAFVYPFRRKGGARPMPISVVAMAIVFNSWNAYLNGRWLFALGPERGAGWLCDPRFIGGAALFLAGMAINVRSDETLLALRRPGELEYRIPRGGLFRFVTMPNYLGELVEWLGWALATWSLAGLAFAVFTAANLVPRAMSNHKWYLSRFPDYPKERRAIIPFVL